MLDARAVSPPTHPGVRTRRTGQPSANHHVADLSKRLSISEVQREVWSAFAETLLANNRRMVRNDRADEPFGDPGDRLAALAAMKAAAARLFELLDPAQQDEAMQQLPLCCLPQPAVWSRISGGVQSTEAEHTTAFGKP